MEKITHFFKDLSIKWRLFLLQAFLVLLIVASIGVVSVWELQGGIEKNQRERLLALAGEVANLSANNLHNADDRLVNLARSHAVKAYAEGGDVRQLEKKFKENTLLFPELSYINAVGVETIRVVAGKSVSTHRSYPGSSLLKLASTHKGSVVMGEPYMSDSVKGPVVDMVCQACSLNAKNDFTLRASLSLQLLSNALSDIEISSGGFFVLLNKEGSILASSQPAYLTQHLTAASVGGVVGSQDTSNGEQLLGRTNLLGCDCIIVKGIATLSDVTAIVAVPYVQYFAPIRHLRQNIIMICVVAFLVAIFLVGWLAEKFMEPIRLLTKAAAGIAQDGALDRYVKLQSKDEVGVLAESFNSMLSRLSSTHHDLVDERRYMDNILRSLADMLIVTDLSGRIVRINGNCEQKLHYALGHLMEQRVDRLFKGGEALISTFTKEVGENGEIHNVETLMLASDGAEIPVMLSVSIIRDPLSQMLFGFVFIAKDITDRKFAEQELQRQHDELQEINHRLELANNQLLQAEKLAAIGQLAAGIAHEINNPIGYVNSNLATLELYIGNLLQLVNVYKDAEPLLQEHGSVLENIRSTEESMDLGYIKSDMIQLLRESQEGMTRVKQIVADLKGFSRADSQDIQPCDLRAGMDTTLNIVGNVIKYKVKIVKEYGDIPDVECNPGHINQVFMNILLNAAQSIDGDGTIWIRTGVKDAWVWVEIEDTGKGIAPENLNRIFEPFFTTKPVGKGTGLGLSLSYGIVDKHGGRIEVDSTINEGARFRIWLPVRHSQINSLASGS